MLFKAVVVAFLAVVVAFVLRCVYMMGFHVHFHKHHPGQCRLVKGHNFGSEDFETTADGLTLITSGVYMDGFPPGFLEFIRQNNIKGRIYLFDFKQPDLGVEELKIKPSKNFNIDTFHPHGISLLEDKTKKGDYFVYVINHVIAEDDRVEKFKFSSKTKELVHIKSIYGKELTLANDLAVTGEDTFYISNFLFFKSHLGQMAETILNLGLNNILYYNGKEFTEVADKLWGPNGVLLSPDGRHLYVNFPNSKELHVFERKKDNSLELKQKVPLLVSPDNVALSVQQKDVLYTGNHPLTHRIAAYMQDPGEKAPSSVLRIPLKNGLVLENEITELFYDHGDLISASTIATVYNNKLLIGSVLSKLVLCDANLQM